MPAGKCADCGKRESWCRICKVFYCHWCSDAHIHPESDMN